MSGVVVRTCGARDAAVAAQVLSAVVSGTADAAHLAGVLADRDVILCVATADGRPAGIAYGYVYPRLKDTGRAALLYEVDVAEPYRRRGVGTALMEAFAAACRERGAPAHWLVSERANVAATRLYEKSGGVRSDHDDALYRFAGAGEPAS